MYVSVPTRGLLITNKWIENLPYSELIVSVPTRGLLIPNHKAQVRTLQLILFPSPQGVS